MSFVPEQVAVEATSKQFRVLVHQPSGEGFDEAGKGLWPADQFTFRLIGEGSIRRVPEEASTTTTAPAAAKGK